MWVGPSWAADTVQVRFEDASPEDVVAWAAERTGRDGFVVEGTTGEVDVSTGPVSPEAALNAVVDGLEAAGLRVTVTPTALTVADPALPAGTPARAVARAAAVGVPRGPCPGTTSRAALGDLGPSVRVFGTPVPAAAPLGPGLRLSGIPRGGPVSVLGLRSGDVLEAVDGPVQWRPKQGLPALKTALVASVDADQPVTFRVRRRGRPVTWTCHVLPSKPSPPTGD